MAPIALPPAAGESVEVHADWLEWQAIVGNADFVSWADYLHGLRLATSKSELNQEIDVASDPHETLIDEIAGELQAREESAGSGYPFSVVKNGLERIGVAPPYEFMLAMTLFGIAGGPKRSFPERLFEEICARALSVYLGHPAPGVQHVLFGFPRRTTPSKFSKAVDSLCHELAEGRGCKEELDANNMKDAALDVVAWRAFPDRLGSQLIVFGQCSAGEDWREKLTTLHPRKWCQLWMQELPAVEPVSAFFVPRRIEARLLRQALLQGGVLFDRCRIAWLATELEQPLVDAITKWTKAMMQAGVSSAA